MASPIKVILVAFVMLLSIEVCCAGIKDAAVGGITDEVYAKGVEESHHFWRLRKEHRKNVKDKRKHFGHKIHIEINVPKGSTILDQDVQKKARWQKREKMIKEKTLEVTHNQASGAKLRLKIKKEHHGKTIEAMKNKLKKKTN